MGRERPGECAVARVGDGGEMGEDGGEKGGRGGGCVYVEHDTNDGKGAICR